MLGLAVLLAATTMPLSVSDAQANVFGATGSIQMPVDAGKAMSEDGSERAPIHGTSLRCSFEAGTRLDSGSRALRTLISGERLEMIRGSKRRIRGGSPVTPRLSDKRGSSPPLSDAADIGGKCRETRMAGAVTDAVAPTCSIVDVTSLPRLFMARTPPLAPLSAADADSRSIRLADFRMPREELWAGAKVASTRPPSAPRGASEPLIEIWLRIEGSFPPRVRGGMSARDGTVADPIIKTLPPVFRAG